MLEIRREQLANLGASDRREFVDRIVPHLQTEHPTWNAELGAEGTRAFVERAIEAAAGYDIFGRQAVLTFVELRIEFGESFERSPDRAWAQALVSHRTLPDRIKVEILSERLRALTRGRVIVELSR